MEISKEAAEKALEHLRRDIEMLKSGKWFPDKRSCDAALDNIGVIDAYIKETK